MWSDTSISNGRQRAGQKRKLRPRMEKKARKNGNRCKWIRSLRFFCLVLSTNSSNIESIPPNLWVCVCVCQQIANWNQISKAKSARFYAPCIRLCAGFVSHSVNNISSGSGTTSGIYGVVQKNGFQALQFGLHSNYFLELLFFVALSLCKCWFSSVYVQPLQFWREIWSERWWHWQSKSKRRATSCNRVVCSVCN